MQELTTAELEQVSGGLLFLVIGAALLLSGCAHCGAGRRSAMPNMGSSGDAGTP